MEIKSDKKSKGRSKKLKIFVVCTAALLLLLAVAAAVYFLFFGGNDNVNKIVVNEEMIINTIDTDFDKTANLFSDIPEYAEETPEYITSLESRQSIEVLEFTEDGSYVTTKLKVVAPNLYSVVKGIDNGSKQYTEDEIKIAVAEGIKTAELITTEVELQLQLVDGQYKPVYSYEFLDAYYGGFYKLYYESIINSMQGGVK